MRRIVAFVGLLFLAFVLIFGSSNEGMRLLSQRRYMRQDGWGADKFTFGDLYGLTYIKPFKMPRDTSFVALPVLETDSANYKMHIIGDSYLYSFFSMDPRYFEKTGAVSHGQKEYFTYRMCRAKFPTIDASARNSESDRSTTRSEGHRTIE